MHKQYHVEITERALGERVSSEALAAIIAANVYQDRVRGQIGHHEYHFDHNAFEAGYAYMEAQREIIAKVIADVSGGGKEAALAWQAFGRMIHAAQDFYAHSNYVRLWWESEGRRGKLPPEAIDPARADLLNHPELRSGKIYFMDWLAFVPGCFNLAQRLLPADSHTRMNLDSPANGPLFPYALEAAVKRTVCEYQAMQERLSEFATFFHSSRRSF